MNQSFTSLQKNEPKEIMEQLSKFKKNSIATIWKTVLLTALMLSLLLGYNSAYAQVYCTMVCNDNLNISVGNECSATILYDMILEDGNNSYSCSPNGRQAFKIEVMDEQLNVIPTSPTIPYEYVGRTLTVKVKHWATGNNCWATINLQDKIAPRLTCPVDITIPCTESTDPSVTGKATITDCGSGSNVYYDDIYTDLDCGDPIGKITRIWTAEDGYGNKSQCTQIIYIARPNISYILFPPNRDKIANAAISCVDVNANPNRTSPEYTGYPTINGKPITGLNGDICKLNTDYTDQIINACSGTYKILRTWTILNWCTSELKTAVQIIEVTDDTPPAISVPADITVGTQTVVCQTSVPLLPASISDACSKDISVRIISPFNTINGNGGTLFDVSVGTHIITYEATDACGNKATKSMKLTVVDDDPPIVVCEDETIVSLTSDGTAIVFAESFDDGSYDNCCFDQFLARRVGDATFTPTVKFDCTDNEVMVELQVSDCYGNANTCMVSVTIQDKVEPTMVCPGDKTIDCESDYSDLSIFGQPQIFDNCGFEFIESTLEDLDNCGQGTIKRTWTAMGTGGESTSCTQTITVINASPWNLNGDQLIWPKDYETSECLNASALDPDDLPDGFNKPTFIGDNGCSLVGTNYEDLVLDIEPPACFKILRTWTVIDWCQFDANSGNNKGRYEFEQIIKVIDNSDPTFGSDPTDFTVDMLNEGCGGTVTILNVGVSDCNPNAQVTAQGALGNGFGPFTNVMPGIYDMKYIATDGCGNSITKDVKITVRDGKKPTPICIDGLAITIMQGDSTTNTPAMIDLWAIDLNAKSFDNCTAEQNLIFKIRKYDPNSTTAPGADKVTFDCSELGEQEVEVWVIDEEGNADFCVTTVDVQDNMNACNGFVDPGGMIALSGKIATETGEGVSKVSVQITHPDKTPYVTGDDGIFRYEQLPGNLDYALIPEKNVEPKNGINTLDIIKMRKHILRTEILDSPYKLIAADVDRSGAISTLDLIQTRKLLLGKQEKFPNNESWRFVSKEYVFQNGANPLTEDFSEIAIVPQDSRTRNQVDFVAIKIGDVDYSAKANGLLGSGSQGRNTPDDLLFDLEDQRFVADEILTITFNANNFEEVLGYQFELKFNTEVIDFQQFKKGAIENLSDSNFGWNEVNKGLIKVSWDDRDGWTIANGKALFTFQFKAKKSGTLSQIISFENGALSPQAYSIYDETYNLKINFKEQESIIKTVELFQNQPNPFDEQTTIRFNLPSPQKATLSIFDVSGKVLKQLHGDYSKGEHAIIIEKAALPSFGLMYYTLETETEKIVRKMISLNR